MSHPIITIPNREAVNFTIPNREAVNFTISKKEAVNSTFFIDRGFSTIYYYIISFVV